MGLRPTTEMIVSAQGGDIEAIASLLAAAQPDIRRYARVSCRTADVDDAVQDALVLLQRHVGRLRVISAFSSWLFAVVRHECSRLAKRVRGVQTPIEDIDNDLRFSTRLDADLRLDLAGAINSLPPHYRQLVVLRDIEELTIDEIAQTLDASREAVKARLHRARVLLREYLQR
ncbi:RNA polymerase sigma factor [Devosia sp.]|uniref:RNA polymerase sigma factor n=1 Tax=Devosia sp. TaxID=1871048 RepID=UPI003BA925BE